MRIDDNLSCGFLFFYFIEQHMMTSIHRDSIYDDFLPFIRSHSTYTPHWHCYHHRWEILIKCWYGNFSHILRRRFFRLLLLLLPRSDNMFWQIHVVTLIVNAVCLFCRFSPIFSTINSRHDDDFPTAAQKRTNINKHIAYTCSREYQNMSKKEKHPAIKLNIQRMS